MANGHSPQWTANLRAERDLLRQLVPVISSSADSELRTPNSALDLTVHDPHPNRLPIPRDDHAEALANFALVMRDSLAEYNQIAGTNLQLRIGLNSGPVVAGVIGKRRFLYDLWGDSVNTSSRIETHGIPGEIQVTEATRELLEVGSRFTFIDRGLIDIKGKGPMQTYLSQPNGHA